MSEKLDVVPPVTPQVSDTPLPSNLLSEQDKRTLEINSVLQKTKSVLGTVLAGIVHVMEEIINLILQR